MHWPSHIQRQDKIHHPLKGSSETIYNNKGRVVTHIVFVAVLFYNHNGPALYS